MQHADLSTSPLTINSERLQVLEFSKPFMQFTMSLISKKVDTNDHDLTTFMLPYSTTVWLVTLACLLFVTVLMYLVNFFSPYGHRSRHRHQGETGEEFDFYNSLWFCLASMLQQGADHTPKSFSGKLYFIAVSHILRQLPFFTLEDEQIVSDGQIVWCENGTNFVRLFVCLRRRFFEDDLSVQTNK